MSRRPWLVTGGAGFIGANFTLYARQVLGQPVVVLDKLTYAGNLSSLDPLRGDPDFTFVQGDIGDAALLADLLRTHRPAAMVHFAAESHVDRSLLGPRDFIDTNIVGTFTLLEAARQYQQTLPPEGHAVFRFLHVSTDEVYGSLTPEAAAFHEHTPYAPNSPYSASKAASDHLVRAWHHSYGLPVLTTNCSNNYGPLQFPEKLIPLMLCKALAGEALPVYGDGQNVRDWLYVLDHCKGIARVLSQGQLGETYCIGGCNEQTNLSVVETLCQLLDARRPRADGLSYRQQLQFVTDRPGHDRRYAIDASRMRQELGWQPEETFSSGLAKTVDWYLANEAWLQRVQSGTYRQWLQTQYGDQA